MKLPIKRFATSALALLLTVAMLMSTAGAIEFSGIPGGGGAQQNGDGTVRINLYSVRATTYFNEHLIGYRFSVVTDNGKLKSGTTVKDIYLEEALVNLDNYLGMSGLFFYRTAARTATKLPKSEIRQTYTDEYATLSENTVGPGSDDVLDSQLSSLPNLPLSPDRIEVWCTDDGGERLNALLVGAGVIKSESGLAILDNTDRILVEPIFEMKLGGEYFALTATEIGVYEYHAYKNGALNKYGQTYASDGFLYCNSPKFSDAYADAVSQGAIIESALSMLNYRYPEMLVENGAGIPEGSNSKFWETTVGCSRHTVPDVSSNIISIADLIERGFGVAVVWKNDTIEETCVKLQYHPNGGRPSPTANNEGYNVDSTTKLLTKNGVLIETIIPKGEKGTPEDWTPMDLTWNALGEESGTYSLNTSKMWNTKADGNGEVLVPGTDYNYAYLVELADENGVVTLYAIWDKKENDPEPEEPELENPKQLIIKYHANGGTSGSIDVWSVGTDGFIETADDHVDVITIVSEGEKTSLGDWSMWKLTREGYTLNTSKMWNTKKDGNGKTFKPGVSRSYDEYLPYAKDGVVILYAMWDKEGTESETPKQLIIKYHTNGGTLDSNTMQAGTDYIIETTGGVDATTTVSEGKTASLRYWTNWRLSKEGYILNESLMWNTKKDGNLNDVLVPGTEYSYSDLVELDTDGDGVVILYAMWDKEGTEPDPEEPKPESITVVYSPNGGSVGNGYTINGGVIYKSGKRVETVFQKNGQKARLCDWNDFGLTRSGYELWTFNMWKSEASGGGKVFSLNISHSYDDLVKLDTDGDGVVILYAVWDKEEEPEPEPEDPKQLIVKYHANGGILGSNTMQAGTDGIIESRDGVDATTTVSEGKTNTLKYWTNWKLSREGYTLNPALMWNTKADGKGDVLVPGTQYSYSYLVELADENGVVILYASWDEDEPEPEPEPEEPEPEPDKEYEYLYIKLHINGGEMQDSSLYKLASNDIIEYKGKDYIARLTIGYWKNGVWYNSSPVDSCSLPTSKVLGFVTKETSIFSKTTFVGWNTSQNGTGKSFKDGEKVWSSELERYAKGDYVTLYAQWYEEPSPSAPIVIKVNCYVDDEPANFPFDGAVDIQSYDESNSITKKTIALSNINSIGVEGDKSLHYVISAYASGDSTTYYPIQKASPSTPLFIEKDGVYEYNIYYYTLSYDGNSPTDTEATNIPPVQYLLEGIIGEISGCSPSLDTHSFIYWATDRAGQGTRYNPRQSIVLVTPLVLYAQWINIPSDHYADLVVLTYINDQGTNIRTHGLDVRAEQVVTADGEEYVIDRYLRPMDDGHYYVSLSFESPYRVITTDENGVDWYLTADGSYTTTVTTLPTPTSQPTHRIYYYTITYLPNPPAEGDASMPTISPCGILTGSIRR